VNLHYTPAEEAFRAEVRDFLESSLARPEFSPLRGRGGPGDEHTCFEPRQAWERFLGAAGYIGLGWPTAYGGRDATLVEQVIFHEEYARAKAPGRLGHIGEMLLGPTLLAFGTEAQKQQFLPPIKRGEALWCQGYSEPEAGSDLANVRTVAVRDGDAWVITGQKTWTSHGQWADACFVLCRTRTDGPKHAGLSYVLVPMRQPGIEVRPIKQMTGTSEFNEVFFDGARAPLENVVGEVDGGWKVAMGTLAFERGASTLGQQLSFENELKRLIEVARARGLHHDPVLRDRLTQAWMGLEVMRLNTLRMLTALNRGVLVKEALISKLYWSNWHRDLGKLAMDLGGLGGEILAGAPYELDEFQRLFLFARADTIYAGTNEIQRNLIAQRALELPKGP
jgi:alkylation response protein AidB-like acyl-CoA dehydrogenase